MGIRRLILFWLATTLGIAGFLAFRLTGEDRSLFLPAELTDGHYQIELACDACPTPFGGVR